MHALLNAVKVGCIPVVFRDFYPLFAPSFPSTLIMEDYCVYIKEADFIRDPAVKELLKLKDLGETLIRHKHIPFVDDGKSVWEALCICYVGLGINLQIGLHGLIG